MSRATIRELYETNSSFETESVMENISDRISDNERDDSVSNSVISEKLARQIKIAIDPLAR